MPGRALPKYLAGPPSELSPLPSPPPTHPGGRRRAPCPPRGPQGGPQPPTPALAQLVPDTSCLSRPLCWSERAAELRRWPRGEGGSQGPVAACPAGMGGGWRELGHPSRHLTGGPQESPPLCSKYYRPLETPGNPGQHGAGLVTRGESGLQQLSCFDLGGWGMSRASGTSALWPALPQGSWIPWGRHVAWHSGDHLAERVCLGSQHLSPFFKSSWKHFCQSRSSACKPSWPLGGEVKWG